MSLTMGAKFREISKKNFGILDALNIVQWEKLSITERVNKRFILLCLG